jgi:hypothetical protein
VILHARTEHIELALIPSADDVDGVATVADVIDHGRLFGRQSGVVHRDVRRREHRRIFGQGADAPIMSSPS